jgi:chromosome segregation ATPase
VLKQQLAAAETEIEGTEGIQEGLEAAIRLRDVELQRLTRQTAALARANATIEEQQQRLAAAEADILAWQTTATYCGEIRDEALAKLAAAEARLLATQLAVTEESAKKVTAEMRLAAAEARLNGDTLYDKLLELKQRLAAAEAERDALFERTKHDIYVSLGVGQKLTTAEQKLQEIYTAASCIVEKQAQLGRSKSGLYPHFDAQWVCRTIKPVEGVVE